VGHAGGISVTPVSSRSAEFLYEPSELAARSVDNRCRFELPTHRSPVGRCATPGLHARPTPDPDRSAVTFLSGRDGDIYIRWTHPAGR